MDDTQIDEILKRNDIIVEVVCVDDYAPITCMDKDNVAEQLFKLENEIEDLKAFIQELNDSEMVDD